MLYGHKVLGAKPSLDLMGLMTNTDFEDRLPQPLPKYVEVPHKIGTEAHGVINDAAICRAPRPPVRDLRLLRRHRRGRGHARAAEISQAVFDYESVVP